MTEELSIPGSAKSFLSSPERTDRLWGPPSRMFSGYRDIPGVKVFSKLLITYIHPVPRLRIRGDVLPSPHKIPSWHEPVLFIFTSGIQFSLARLRYSVLWFGVLTAMQGV
jgi:hypothetical protein